MFGITNIDGLTTIIVLLLLLPAKDFLDFCTSESLLGHLLNMQQQKKKKKRPVFNFLAVELIHGLREIHCLRIFFLH